MAKLLLGEGNKVIRNIKDARIFPAEWYVKEDFPNWDIVQVMGTPEEVTAGAQVETARSEDPEAEDQNTYWKDGSTWYKVEKSEFDLIYDAITGAVVSAVSTYAENKVDTVTQEYIDSLGA